MGFHLQPYEEIHLHSGWCRGARRGLRTKNRNGKSAVAGKEGDQHHGGKSIADCDEQDGDGDQHDN